MNDFTEMFSQVTQVTQNLIDIITALERRVSGLERQIWELEKRMDE